MAGAGYPLLHRHSVVTDARATVTVMSSALPTPLVSTQWLADHLGGDGLVVLDASVANFVAPNGKPGYLSGHEQYIVNGHIPGAGFADVIDELSDPEGRFPFTRPSAERFADAAGRLGIGPESSVVVYDSAVGQWAARVWWLLRSFGHDRVAVLDGGLTKWKAEGREIDTGHIELPESTFDAVEQPGFWVDKSFIERVLRGEEHAALVCATPPKEFSGEASPRSRAGHIPGSVSVPAGRLVDRETNAVLPADRLRDAFAGADAPDSPDTHRDDTDRDDQRSGTHYVAYCGGGIAATAAALALTAIGETHISVYDGSLNEWVADADAPLEVSVGASA